MKRAVSVDLQRFHKSVQITIVRDGKKRTWIQLKGVGAAELQIQCVALVIKTNKWKYLKLMIVSSAT